MSSKLDQLREMTVVVADTGDIDAIRTWRPVDCTTNPTLLLKAFTLPGLSNVVQEVLQWGRDQKLAKDVAISRIADRLAVSVGTELTRIVPGRVSTEVDANLSFDTEASVEKARQIIAAYAERGVARNRILIKLASSWEGIQAARILQKEGIDCNMTLLFCLAQAMASADAGAFLISPFVGRIFDWYVKNEGRKFRSAGQVEALAGCDRLTISPSIMEEMSKDTGNLPRKLSPQNPGTPPEIPGTDERAFRWAMNEDPMATEKLSEGIRVFNADLKKLRATIGEKL
jgi:transaldolase